MSTRDQTIPPRIQKRVDELEAFMRTYFVKRFEAREALNTPDSALNAISAMEKARMFIAYPDHEFSRDLDVKRSAWIRLNELYIAER